MAKSELSALKLRTFQVNSDKPLEMLDFAIRISGLLRTDREKAPHTWIFVQAWGASFYRLRRMM